MFQQFQRVSAVSAVCQVRNQVSDVAAGFQRAPCSSASMSDIEDITADAEAELPRDDFTGVAHVRAKGKGGRQPHSVRQYFTSTSTVPGADHPDSQCNY